MLLTINQQQGGLMSYYDNIDCFLITAHPKVFYSFNTIAV